MTSAAICRDQDAEASSSPIAPGPVNPETAYFTLDQLLPCNKLSIAVTNTHLPISCSSPMHPIRRNARLHRIAFLTAVLSADS